MARREDPTFKPMHEVVMQLQAQQELLRYGGMERFRKEAFVDREDETIEDTSE